MGLVTINSVTGLNPPYTIYVCDVYGNVCAPIAVQNSPIPMSINLLLPPAFNLAPAIGIKIVTSDGCTRFEVLDCTVPPLEQKEFQDSVLFDFMDTDPYYFQN